MGLESLNEGLEEIARLRLQYPELTLKELGIDVESTGWKVWSKSPACKLSLLADDLREKQGGVIGD